MGLGDTELTGRWKPAAVDTVTEKALSCVAIRNIFQSHGTESVWDNSCLLGDQAEVLRAAKWLRGIIYTRARTTCWEKERVANNSVIQRSWLLPGFSRTTDKAVTQQWRGAARQDELGCRLRLHRKVVNWVVGWGYGHGKGRHPPNTVCVT